MLCQEATGKALQEARDRLKRAEQEHHQAEKDNSQLRRLQARVDAAKKELRSAELELAEFTRDPYEGLP